MRDRSVGESVSGGPAAAGRVVHHLAVLASDLRVALHVQCVHLVEDECNGVLSNDADVSTHRRQLLVLKLYTTAQLFVFSHQLVTCLSITRITPLDSVEDEET